MILVDSSIWVAHLRDGNVGLENLLIEGNVACHPFIVGELACGNIENRKEIISLLQSLPMALQAEHDEVLQFIDNHRLMGTGLGYIDMHLLASANLTKIPLWTLDKTLHKVSLKLGLTN
jgi:predicted nucleic acid-binding protein